MTTTILSLGGGVDSTALLAIDLHRDEAADLLGLDRADLDRLYPKLDQVVFSDTGAEFDETYDNIALARKKCMAAGLPFTIVSKKTSSGRSIKEDLPEFLNRLGCLPTMPGQSHLCSVKFKGEVMTSWAEDTFTGEIQFVIGIEANETRRTRFKMKKKKNTKNTYTPIYPLVALDLDRAKCEMVLRHLWDGAVRKSSCFFCPYMQEGEIAELINENPEKWEAVKAIEENFRQTSIVKHQKWIDAGKPTRSDGKAPEGMWSRDSYAEGKRLFAKTIGGKQLSAIEWEARLKKGQLSLFAA